MLPSHFKNPFIDSEDRYRTVEIFAKLTLNDLVIVPFQNIAIRVPDPKDPWSKISKVRILEADTRFPGIIYKSHLDPLNQTKKEYCVFDGTHRLLKMKYEGKTSSLFYILKPNAFDGLVGFNKFTTGRTTACNSCEE